MAQQVDRDIIKYEDLRAALPEELTPAEEAQLKSEYDRAVEELEREARLNPQVNHVSLWFGSWRKAQDKYGNVLQYIAEGAAYNLDIASAGTYNMFMQDVSRHLTGFGLVFHMDNDPRMFQLHH